MALIAWMDEAQRAAAARKLCAAVHLAARHPTENTLAAMDRLACELESLIGKDETEITRKS